MGKGVARKDKGKRPQKWPMKCFVCGAAHRFFECPKWKSLLALENKKASIGKLKAQAPTPISCGD